MRLIFWLALFSVPVLAQPDLNRLTQELRVAIQNDSLASAVDLANRLDDAVRERQRAALTHGSDERVNEVLSWLPADVESLWVNQEPFAIEAGKSALLLFGKPTQLYSTDRLDGLDGGKWSRALENHRARMVAGAARNVARPVEGNSVPQAMPNADAVYFYFFEDLPLPAADEMVEGRPVWHAIGKLDAGRGPLQRGVPRETNDEENWIAEAQPGVLILSNRHELLTRILERIASHSASRVALPADLGEWKQIDKNAPFWGLRHYSDQSKSVQEASGEPASARLSQPDATAIGVTMCIDSTLEKLEIRYLSKAQLTGRGRLPPSLDLQFTIDQPEPGLWRMAANIHEKGAFPVHFAMAMLGFGIYQGIRMGQ